MPETHVQKREQDAVRECACPGGPSPREGGSSARPQTPGALLKPRVHAPKLDLRRVRRTRLEFSAHSARRRPDLAQTPGGWLVSFLFRAALRLRGYRPFPDPAEISPFLCDTSRLHFR